MFLQRQEDDTVIVVHPHRDDWRDARPDDYQTYRSAHGDGADRLHPGGDRQPTRPGSPNMADG